MLLGNYSVFNKNSGREFGGRSNPYVIYKGGSLMQFYTGDSTISGETEKSSIFNGYRPPYTWRLAPVAGGLGSINNITLDNSITLLLVSGKNAESDLTINLDVTNAQLGLIVAAIANLSMIISTTANLTAIADLESDLTISTAVTSSLGALAEAVANLNIIVTVTGSQYAVGNMSADITSNTTLSPENLAAAVWNSIALAFNTSGTMGEIMNNIGAGADPWSTILPGTYTGDQAGKLVADLETLIKQVKALTSANL